MLRFAANLSTLFQEVAFVERFARAHAAGFRYVEFQFPYESDAQVLQNELKAHEQQVVLFNLPPGDWAKGDRGISIFADRRDDFRASVELAIEYGQALNCQRFHCMAGIRPEGLPEQEAWHIYEENVRYASDKLASHDSILLIEPINRSDMPGYFLSDVRLAHEALATWNLPNVRLQFDFYHVQRMHGELIGHFQSCQDWIGHVQIADNPGRHQPGTGEINFSNIFTFLENEGYNGFIGLEYIPDGQTEHSFTWMRGH